MRNTALTRVRRELREVASAYAIRKAISAVLRDHEAELVALLQGQLEEGKMAGSRGREKYINPLYSLGKTGTDERYARRKQRMNSKPPWRVPDLKLSGDFHGSISVRVGATTVAFESSDWKADKLLEKYGQVLMLSRERWNRFNREVVAPELRRRILDKVKR